MFHYGSGSPLDSLLFNCQPETKYLQLAHQSWDPSSNLLAMEVFWVFWNQQKEKHLPPFTTRRHRHRHTHTHTHTHALRGSSPRMGHQLRGKFCPEWCYPSHYHAGQFHILLRISPFPKSILASSLQKQRAYWNVLFYLFTFSEIKEQSYLPKMVQKIARGFKIAGCFHSHPSSIQKWRRSRFKSIQFSPR